MDSLSAFEFAKHSAFSNENERFHNTPIISYGRIIKVIDIHTVVVEAAVKVSLSIETYIVPLLSLSSALAELNVYPEIGDKVLLLFLQRFDPDMFTAEEIIENPDATGYNNFSGVGILLTTFKGYADTVMRFLRDDETSVAELESNAKWRAVFNSDVGITFCRAVFDSNDEQIISMLFGEGRPLVQQFLSKVTREYGFWKDQDDNPVELDAAVVERYSQYAPITKDIQGTQNITIGIDDEGNDTDADVDITLGASADINIDSESGLAIETGRDIALGSDGDVKVEAGGDVKIKADSDVEIKAGVTGLIGISNQIASLKEILDEYNDILSSLDVTATATSLGSPCAVVVGAVANPRLAALKIKQGQVLK